MATMGLKYMAWAKNQPETMTDPPVHMPGMVIGRSVSTNLTVTNAEGELYADDMLAEYVSEFTSADFTAEVDNIELRYQAMLYGATYDDENGLQHFANDNAPYGGFGGYQVLLVKNVRKYRAWYFPKAKASIPDWSGSTKNNSISFGTQPIKAKILSPSVGPWYVVKEFTTEAAAQAFVDEKLGVAIWHTVSVQAQGADGATKIVSPTGGQTVADGGTLTLTITGTPKALYDNGVDKLSAIAQGAYTLTDVTADHAIAVIF